MINKLTSEIVHVCSVLNKHSVEYLIIGGTAVALYGFYRLSTNDNGQIAEKPDIDFWYNPSYPNYFNLINALEELGQNVNEFRHEKTPNPKKSFFKLNLERCTLDFLPQVIGLERFFTSFSKRVTSTMYETEVYLIPLDDLIKSKHAIGRTKDIADIKKLEQLR